MSTRIVEKGNDSIDIIELANEQLIVTITNFGATIMGVLTKDRQGQWTNVVLGYKHVADYDRNAPYLGALVGRVANRIRKGSFTLNNTVYQLPINNGPNSLHGGLCGFSFRVFDYELMDNAVVLTYCSADGEEGYPGELTLKATYTLEGQTLSLAYDAVTTKDTLINITNHTYFNLTGHPCSIDDHLLTVKASHYAPVDADGLVTGEVADVTDTPFDFRTPVRIGDQIHQAHAQLMLARGIDHPFIFDDDHDQVILYSDVTGIELTVSTTLPQAQLYSANYFDGRLDRNDEPLNERDGLAIETQNMPDAIHVEDAPTTILRAGDHYHEVTSWTFKIR